MKKIRSRRKRKVAAVQKIKQAFINHKPNERGWNYGAETYVNNKGLFLTSVKEKGSNESKLNLMYQLYE